MNERPYVRVARIEEQDSLGNESRYRPNEAPKGFDIYRSVQEDKTIVYMAGPDAKATINQVAPDTVEFSIPNHERIEPQIASALALVAFATIATDKTSSIKKVVSYVPRSLENPEYNGPSPDPLFVDVLGMEGEGLTPEGKLHYKGEPREMLWVATEALRKQTLIYSKVTKSVA